MFRPTPQPNCDLDGFGPNGFPSDCLPAGMLELPISPYKRVSWQDPLPLRPPASPLPRVTLEPSSVEVIERLPNGLYEGAPSGVFRVNIADMGERLLKVFHGFEKPHKGRSFFREARAYEVLLQEGVCAAGVVPHCYGYTVIDQTKWVIPGRDDWLLPFRADPKPLRVMVLEFLPNASKMTLRWTTPQTAQAALDGLDMIHRAGVVHDDIHPRNILVLPHGRVVWIDFELAGNWSRNYWVNESSFQNELAQCWSWLYRKLLVWKWCALRESYQQGKREDQIQLEAVEKVLVSHGCTLLDLSKEARGTTIMPDSA